MSSCRNLGVAGVIFMWYDLPDTPTVVSSWFSLWCKHPLTRQWGPLTNYLQLASLSEGCSTIHWFVWTSGVWCFVYILLRILLR
jgi:hypothetical protein